MSRSELTCLWCCAVDIFTASSCRGGDVSCPVCPRPLIGCLCGAQQAMRYDAVTALTNSQEPLLARAKNTSRAEARRRTRDQMRAELVAESGEEATDETVETTAVVEPRRPLFKMPDVRAD